MEKGSLLLIHARFDPIARVIQLFTRSYWSHVGIILNNNQLLEVKGRNIVISASRKYIYNKFYICKIVKIKGLKPTQIKKAIDYMVDITEKGYFKWVMACCMTFFDSKKPLPRRTCSGLIAEAFSKVGFYFRKDKTPDKITPGDIAGCGQVKNITGKELYRRFL